MGKEVPFRRLIERHLVVKSNMHQQVMSNTATVFSQVKEALRTLCSELNRDLEERLHRNIRIDYRDKGKLVAQARVADDLLVFTLHTNVFHFNRGHDVWRNPYVVADKRNSYCGMISIYNFLYDSVKYNRTEDEGYLIARMFVNREMHYFVEGKRQMAMRHNDFGNQTITREAIMQIIECSVNYALEFDLLVPPYDIAKVVSVDQLNTRLQRSNVHTGKRLGYKFNSDDV